MNLPRAVSPTLQGADHARFAALPVANRHELDLVVHPPRAGSLAKVRDSPLPPQHGYLWGGGEEAEVAGAVKGLEVRQVKQIRHSHCLHIVACHVQHSQLGPGLGPLRQLRAPVSLPGEANLQIDPLCVVSGNLDHRLKPHFRW
eukprot:CAMPEP_0169485824 /NCGR_PEP_ID=MMETSP1042-20121227/32496_1 /TAXON_ID=464988 /ORGANISM="Hemiselmis andersenii, Strain CCMP1180" /LENGTH=143 /DNA_ID=CAMNT_0009600947 /DNA_START=918 /DNA_END=1349 /DNA_ORIENTATION=-